MAESKANVENSNFYVISRIYSIGPKNLDDCKTEKGPDTACLMRNALIMSRKIKGMITCDFGTLRNAPYNRTRKRKRQLPKIYPLSLDVTDVT